MASDAELALRAADDAEQIEPAGIQRLAAQLDHRAIEQHQLDAQQIVGGYAIFQAVGAAGIHADIAADGAGQLRRRVGRIEETVGRDRVRDRQIGDAGLDDGGAVVEVDLQDAVHAGQRDHQRVRLRDSAP